MLRLTPAIVYVLNRLTKVEDKGLANIKFRAFTQAAESAIQNFNAQPSNAVLSSRACEDGHMKSTGGQGIKLSRYT